MFTRHFHPNHAYISTFWSKLTRQRFPDHPKKNNTWTIVQCTVHYKMLLFFSPIYSFSYNFTWYSVKILGASTIREPMFWDFQHLASCMTWRVSTIIYASPTSCFNNWRLQNINQPFRLHMFLLYSLRAMLGWTKLKRKGKIHRFFYFLQNFVEKVWQRTNKGGRSNIEKKDQRPPSPLLELPTKRKARLWPSTNINLGNKIRANHGISGWSLQ